MTVRLRREILAALLAAGATVSRWEGAAAAATDEIRSGAATSEANSPSDVEDPEGADRVAAARKKHTELFPLPLFATSPSEGITVGVLPVFLRVDGLGRTSSITAPSVSWNSSAGINGTYRYYSVGQTSRIWTLILSASTHVNRSLRFDYRDVPGDVGRGTLEIQILARRNIFYRFFGFGPDTLHSDESSYIRELALLSVRAGKNLFPHFNLGARAGVRGDKPQEGTVQGLPSTFALYPGTPGLSGAALATLELNLRYDSRPRGDYGISGLASELHAARDLGFDGGVSLWRLTWHTRVLVPETSWLTGAARLYWTDQWGGGPNVPFFYRSALGGDTLFRAFTDDRFIDRGAWEAEAEQRILIFRTTWFGVVTDWRMDPFVAVGQVYPDYANIASHVRAAAGVGFRGFVYPNILGRVDVAYSSDGFAAYCLMGYPY
jgi:hypothetical protein